MPRSVSLHPDHKVTARSALERHGFLTQGTLAGHLGLAVSTVSNFFNCKPIYIATFEAICDALDLDKQAIRQPKQTEQPIITVSPTPFYHWQTWVERAELTEPLLQVLRGQHRIVAFTGITGIGKTEFAGRLTSELNDGKRFHRFNLDEGSIAPDFASSGAALLRTLGEEPTLEDQKDAKHLLTHLLKLLRTQPYRVQIDSMEKLLEGNDEDGWSEFCDPLWLDLLQQVLAGNECQSQLILTTQDVPGKLSEVGSRYDHFWYCEPIHGLSEAEQLQLFQKHGVVAAFNAAVEDQYSNVTAHNAIAAGQHPNVTVHNTNAEAHNANAEGQHQIAGLHNANVEAQHRIAETHNPAEANSAVPLLKRIGKLYAGHPLVLRVIAEDIKTCGNDVKRYWRLNNFAELEANRPAELSRPKLQLEVKRRVRAALSRLPKDALDLLCRSAVFRRPVPEAFWLAMLPDCSEPQAALNSLKSRTLAEEDWQPGAWLGADEAIPLRQHNLVRAVAYELLKTDKTTWETAERKAAELWLNNYEPAPDAPNLEKVRGYLEAFEHYCEVEDWEKASKVFLLPLNLDIKARLYGQLDVWSYFQEEIRICEKLLGKTDSQVDIFCLLGLGNAFVGLGRHLKAREFYQKSLDIARQVNDFEREGDSLGNLGLVNRMLGKYKLAVTFHQAQLKIAQNSEDLRQKASALSGLGNCYYGMNDYIEAIEKHTEALELVQQLHDPYGEENVLGSLGVAHDALGKHAEAIKYYEQRLEIVRRLRNIHSEGVTLSDLGAAYINLEKHDHAYDCLVQSLDIAKRISDQEGEGIVEHNLGITYRRLDKNSEALEAFQSASIIFRELKVYHHEAEALKHLAELHQKIGEIELARQYCEQALVLATELGIPLVEECEALKKELEGKA